LDNALPRAEAPRRPTFAGMIVAPHQAIALVFGIGLSPVWPGALGTLAGFALFLALQPLPLAYRIVAYVLLIAIASWAAERTGKDLGSPDHNAIVVDETLGMCLTLEFVSQGLGIWAAAFLLFRLFDVVKPWPVHLPHRRWQGGFFVILDDLLAALYAGLVARYAVMPLLP
jgi:phosphatidylglycerophosphatase A